MVDDSAKIESIILQRCAAMQLSFKAPVYNAVGVCGEIVGRTRLNYAEANRCE